MVAQLLRACPDADAQLDGYTAPDLFADYFGSWGERRSLAKRDKVAFLLVSYQTWRRCADSLYRHA